MANKKGKSVNLDTAARLDIVCRKGDTFTLALDFNIGIPTTGWKMEVRESDDDDTVNGAVLSMDSFVVTNGTTTNSKLTIQAQSSTMEVESGLYVYDLENDSNSTVKTYLYGTFKINEDVTI